MAIKSSIFILMMTSLFLSGISQPDSSIYKVRKLKRAVKIDGKWNKGQWRRSESIELTNYLGQLPKFRPTVKAKMMYDDKNLYVIFRVEDRYVRSVIEEFNGPVSTDACVEIFFAPDTSHPERYFNLEINAGGTPLMAYHTFQQKEYQKVSVEDLAKIEIFHSLSRVVDPEILTPIRWTIEVKLPISLIEKYGFISQPKTGVTWRANFYKIASKTSNPHAITWSLVDNLKPAYLGRFHQPQYFGKLKFVN